MNGRPNRRKKAAFSNSCGVLWTGLIRARVHLTVACHEHFSALASSPAVEDSCSKGVKCSASKSVNIAEI